jgi:hypothetical protein
LSTDSPASVTESVPQTGEREEIFEGFGPEETDDVVATTVAFGYLGFDGDRHRLETCIEQGLSRGKRRQTLSIVGSGDRCRLLDLG